MEIPGNKPIAIGVAIAAAVAAIGSEGVHSTMHGSGGNLATMYGTHLEDDHPESPNRNPLQMVRAVAVTRSTAVPITHVNLVALLRNRVSMDRE